MQLTDDSSIIGFFYVPLNVVMQLADDLSKVGLFYVLLHAVEQLKKKGFYYIASFGDEARW